MRKRCAASLRRQRLRRPIATVLSRRHAPESEQRRSRKNHVRPAEKPARRNRHNRRPTQRRLDVRKKRRQHRQGSSQPRRPKIRHLRHHLQRRRRLRQRHGKIHPPTPRRHLVTSAGCCRGAARCAPNAQTKTRWLVAVRCQSPNFLKGDLTPKGKSLKPTPAPTLSPAPPATTPPHSASDRRDQTPRSPRQANPLPRAQLRRRSPCRRRRPPRCDTTARASRESAPAIRSSAARLESIVA